MKPKKDAKLLPGEALGMVETRGLVGMIEAADAMCNTANVLFVALDPDGNVTQLNEAGEKITGYQQGEVLGKNWFELVVPEERYPKVWEGFEKVKAQGTIVDTYANPILYEVWRGTDHLVEEQHACLE